MRRHPMLPEFERMALMLAALEAYAVEKDCFPEAVWVAESDG